MEGLKNIINRIESVIMVAGMAVMVALNFMNVVARKFMPKLPMSFTEEMVVLIFLWVSMFGISSAYRRHSHTGLNLLTSHLPAPLRAAAVVFSGICSCVFAGILTYTGMQMVQNYIKYGQILPSLRIPMAVQGFAIPVGGAVIIVSIVLSVWESLRQIYPGKEEK